MDGKKKEGFPQVDKCMVNHRTNPKWSGLEGTLKMLLFQPPGNLLEYPSRAISIGFKPSLEHVPNASLDFRWLRTNSMLCPNISTCPCTIPFPSEGLGVLTHFMYLTFHVKLESFEEQAVEGAAKITLRGHSTFRSRKGNRG